MQYGLYDRQNNKDLSKGIGGETKVSLPYCRTDGTKTKFNYSVGTKDSHSYIDSNKKLGGAQQVAPAFSITDKEFYQLAAYIKANYGINLKKEKKALVTSRLHNVLFKNGFKNFSDYYDYIVSDQTGNATTTLVNKITTNHTYFMREPNHFYLFRDEILPHYSSTIRSKDLRIWSAGCSSGEEPYTLAMIMDEYFGKKKFLWDTKILATDISGKVLETAAKGVYENDKIATLPNKWKREYFKQLDNENSLMVDRIRSNI
jgi:chemotaxis protein methyltransferase CheR